MRRSCRPRPRTARRRGVASLAPDRGAGGVAIDPPRMPPPVGAWAASKTVRLARPPVALTDPGDGARLRAAAAFRRAPSRHFRVGAGDPRPRHAQPEEFP